MELAQIGKQLIEDRGRDIIECLDTVESLIKGEDLQMYQLNITAGAVVDNMEEPFTSVRFNDIIGKVIVDVDLVEVLEEDVVILGGDHAKRVLVFLLYSLRIALNRAKPLDRKDLADAIVYCTNLLESSEYPCVLPEDFLCCLDSIKGDETYLPRQTFELLNLLPL